MTKKLADFFPATMTQGKCPTKQAVEKKCQLPTTTIKECRQIKEERKECQQQQQQQQQQKEEKTLEPEPCGDLLAPENRYKTSFQLWIRDPALRPPVSKFPWDSEKAGITMTFIQNIPKLKTGEKYYLMYRNGDYTVAKNWDKLTKAITGEGNYKELAEHYKKLVGLYVVVATDPIMAKIRLRRCTIK